MEKSPGDIQRYIFQYIPKESRKLSKTISERTKKVFYDTECQLPITKNEYRRYIESLPDQYFTNYRAVAWIYTFH